MPTGCQASGLQFAPFSGTMPAWFHVFVFPWCNWMPACLQIASVNTLWKCCTRDGRQADRCRREKHTTASLGSSERATSSNALCIPMENKSGIRGSPCSPPSARDTAQRCPSWSNQQYVDLLCVGEAHERQNLAGTGHLQSLPTKEWVVNDSAVRAQIVNLGSARAWTDCVGHMLRAATDALGIFKDVRFDPKLNFGLFWAALLEMSVFYPTRNVRQFWADPTFSAVRSTFLAEEEAQHVEILPQTKFWPFFGPPPWSPF